MDLRPVEPGEAAEEQHEAREGPAAPTAPAPSRSGWLGGWTAVCGVFFLIVMAQPWSPVSTFVWGPVLMGLLAVWVVGLVVIWALTGPSSRVASEPDRETTPECSRCHRQLDPTWLRCEHCQASFEDYPPVASVPR